MDIRLSSNFTLSELIKSETAQRYHLPNTPDEKAVVALRALALEVLQPIRDHYGRFIARAYRSLAVNQLVGSTPKSQHLKGEAADFEIVGVSNLEVWDWVRESHIPYDQLILEFHDPADPHSGWIHISHIPARPKFQRGQAFKITEPPK